MPNELPDWLNDKGPLLEPGRPPGGRTRDKHLAVLRELLTADHLQQADWNTALEDVARMARDALDASSAMVAVWDGHAESWTARTANGQALDATAISRHGSVSVLDEVRRSDQPLLTVGTESLEVHSMSVARQGIDSVLAVPLRWWEQRGEAGLVSTLGGCLYAHRTAERPAFVQSDVELVTDIARLAEPTLNVLRQLSSLEVEMEAQRQTLDELRSRAAREYRLGKLTSQDPWFGETVLDTLRTVARADKVGLLILGPSGAGKSFLAQAYHYECPRRRGPFVTLDCSQITSATTLGAELFGYAPNSGYANAPPKGRPGKARLADGGTLFLDEIGTVPGDLQQKLLRLIQEGRFAPLGGSREESVDIQIMAATNEPLEQLVERGQFREDLYWRICEMTVELPPLDQRVGDIPGLARRFLESACERFKKDGLTGFTQPALTALAAHRWSEQGNIRGLEHVVTRAVLLAPSGTSVIDVDQLRFESVRAGVAAGPRPSRARAQAPGVAHPTSPRQSDRPAPAAHPQATVGWRAAGRRRKGLRDLLEKKLVAHGADLDAVATDPELRAFSGHGMERIPQSTLYGWIRDLELKTIVKKARRHDREERFEAIAEAIRHHGTASAAARALDLPRNAVIWQLRRAGVTVADVLEGG